MYRIDKEIPLMERSALPFVHQFIPAQTADAPTLLLEQAGADVTLHWEPASHALNRAEVQAATAWLRAHLRNQPL
jgi:predicted esterase